MKIKKSIFWSLLLLCFVSACKIDLEEDTPLCLKKKIRDFKRDAICNEALNVKEYELQGRLVYVFNPGYCLVDGNSEVVDKDCNHLGFLGGFAGNLIIDGVNFSEEAVFIRTVWMDN